MDSEERKFEHLARLVLDGIATDAERAEFGRIAADHSDLLAGIVDELLIDALLNWQSGNIGGQEAEPAVLRTGQRQPRAVSRSPRVIFWTVAATLFVATGFITWRAAVRNADEVAIADSSPIADIVDAQLVSWSGDSTALIDNSKVRRGRLTSAGGEYTLQFRDGSTVRVVGAASLDIKSKMLVQLDRGMATASVPEGSTGFTITSKLVNVVDQGTQFGISVDDGRADVVVFDGKVDLQSNVGEPGSTKRLMQGEAVQVDGQGAIGRLVDVRRDINGRWWAGNGPDSAGSLIARVTDNIVTANDKYVSYQTTNGGLQEDVLAYSDSPHHQWNGLAAEGLPEFLRGADYIRTFNDYRYLLEFEMKVELARPAMLYVFADNRIPTPNWLLRDFEDTGIDIGLDEGPWLDQVKENDRKWDVNTTAVGGGNSIDNVFSIWRRRCNVGGTVTLGNAGEWGSDGVGIGQSSGGGRAMYGIAVTPLEPESTTVDFLDGA